MNLASSSSVLKFNLLGFIGKNPKCTLKTPTENFTFQTSAPRRSRLSRTVRATPPRDPPQIAVRISGDEKFAADFSSGDENSPDGNNRDPIVTLGQLLSRLLESPFYWIIVGNAHQRIYSLAWVPPILKAIIGLLPNICFAVEVFLETGVVPGTASLRPWMARFRRLAAFTIMYLGIIGSAATLFFCS